MPIFELRGNISKSQLRQKGGIYPPVFELELPDLDHLGYHIFGVHNCGYRMGVSFFGGKLYQIYWLDYLEDKNK